MASHADRGKQALERRDYGAAVEAYTAAIKESPSSPAYFIQRSTAHQRAGTHVEALADAEQAVMNAHKRANKDLILDAQFRRGVSLYNLQRYGDAKFVLEHVVTLNDKKKEAGIWLAKTRSSLAGLADVSDDDPRKKCTVTEQPVLPDTSKATTSGPPSGEASVPVAAIKSQSTLPQQTLPVQTAADKIRWDWYQDSDKVHFTLLAKGAPKDQTQVEITRTTLSITFPLQTGSTYDLTLDPLFAPVQPDQCTTRVLPSKIEITLLKTTRGQKWAAFQGTPGAAPTPQATSSATSTRTALADASNSTAPSYPTSSRHGPKNWDKVLDDLRKAEKRNEPRNLDTDNAAASEQNAAQLDGANDDDDDDDDTGGDPANKFFRKLFRGASPEAQRAMMKSYTESNGTALSTNWEEVRQGPVETVAPEGMEAKKWKS